MNKFKMMMMVAMAFCFAFGLPVLADDPAPLGSMETFDLNEVKTTVVPLIYTVIGIVASVLGAGFGFVVLRWGYRKVVSMLK